MYPLLLIFWILITSVKGIIILALVAKPFELNEMKLVEIYNLP